MTALKKNAMMLAVFFYPEENFDKLGGISVPSDDRLWWVLIACLVLSILLNLFLLFRRQLLALLHKSGGEVSENEILAMV